MSKRKEEPRPDCAVAGCEHKATKVSKIDGAPICRKHAQEETHGKS